MRQVKKAALFFILLFVPTLLFGQISTSCTVYVNDSVFKNKFADILITSKQNQVVSIQSYFLNEDKQPLIKISYIDINLNEGFNNLMLSEKNEKTVFLNKQIENYYHQFGNLIPGKYFFEIEVISPLEKPVKREYILEAKTDFTIDIKDKKKTYNDSSNLKWHINLPQSSLPGIQFHLHLAEISKPGDLRKPLAYLKSYQWYPNISTDSFNFRQLRKKTNSGKVYAYYVEAYYQDILISTSQKQFFLSSPKKRKKSLLPAINIGQNKNLAILKAINQGQMLGETKKKFNIPFLQKMDSSHILKFSGSSRMESQVSNIHSPYSQIPASYARLYINPEVEVLNIPIRANVFLYTGDNSQYNLNSFSIDFDAQKFRQNQMNGLQHQNLDFKDYQKMTGNLVKDLRSQKEQLQKRIDSLKAVDVSKQVPALPSYKKYINDSSIRADTAKLLKAGKDSIKEESASYSKNYRNASKAGYDSFGTTEKAYINDFQKDEKLYQHKQDSVNQKIKLYEDALKKIENQIDFYSKSIQNQNIVLPNKDILLKNISLLPGYAFFNKALVLIDDFKLGRFYPLFSELSLNGIAIKGVSASISNQSLFLKCLYGATVPYTNLFTSSPAIKTFGIKAGIGQENGNYVGISFVNFGPDSNRSSHVITASIQRKLFKNFLVQGEVGRSFTTAVENGSPPSTNAFSQQVNDLFAKDRLDIAYTMSFKYQNPITNTKITASTRNVPLNYYSAGSPYLRTDIQEYEIRGEQSLFKKYVLLTGYYKFSSDNMSGLKSSTNLIQNYGLSADIKFKNLPIFRFSINPYQQTSMPKTDSFSNTVKALIWTATMIYNKNLGHLVMSTTCSYSEVFNSYQSNTMVMHNLNVSEMLTFRSGLLLNGSFSGATSSISANDFYSATAGIGSLIMKKWQNTINITYSNSASLSNRTNLTYISALPINSKLKFQMRAGVNFLDKFEPVAPRNQYFLNTTIVFLW